MLPASIETNLAPLGSSSEEGNPGPDNSLSALANGCCTSLRLHNTKIANDVKTAGDNSQPTNTRKQACSNTHRDDGEQKAVREEKEVTNMVEDDEMETDTPKGDFWLVIHRHLHQVHHAHQCPQP